ncbi:hypothetical protein [Streptomyces sp. NPDC006368]|uniref:hypothetical protein n=1 Tax=Streptomyces sp. NPDC006368 TaxID=3156760 RepID=UPI0033B6B771
MRLRNALATGVTAAALATVTLSGPTPAARAETAAPAPGGGEAVAVPDRQPTCGDASDTAFPIETRIKGGPAPYHPGGGFHTWHVELTNTTKQPCGNIHPVIVLTDRTQDLTPAQVQLEFYADGADGRPHPVAVEETDDQELVGVLDNGFPGYTVPPGRTVTVPVRLAFTSDARPDEVTANAAIVQRRGDDGDWVGESGDYRFALQGEAPLPSQEPGTEPGTETGTATGTETGTATGTGTGTGYPDVAEELPKTGLNALLLAVASAVAFLVGAGVQVLVGRSRHRKH